MSGYRLTPNARAGLLQAVALAQERFGRAEAERVLNALERAFERLAEHPEIGHRREDLTGKRSVKFWSVGPTLLAYRLDATQRVEVLFVERAERDWAPLLRRRPE